MSHALARGSDIPMSGISENEFRMAMDVWAKDLVYDLPVCTTLKRLGRNSNLKRGAKQGGCIEAGATL